jgi:5-(carboxyamino)imidazole ribonucleotide synthase
MKVGILGGGQLGRMLLQSAANYDVQTYVLEKDLNCPAAHLCHHFTQGDIQDFDTVYQFGKQLDALTIEIEAVNVDALEQLEKEGVKVYPTPAAIRIIKNKILQKQFYADQEIPTSAFHITQHQSDLLNHIDFLPAVHKLGEGGYDGKGVQVINSESEIELGFNAPSVLEKKVSIAKEIALIVAMNAKGETVIYPPAEMIFDPVYNLLDYQISPAKLQEK